MADLRNRAFVSYQNVREASDVSSVVDSLKLNEFWRISGLIFIEIQSGLIVETVTKEYSMILGHFVLTARMYTLLHFPIHSPSKKDVRDVPPLPDRTSFPSLLFEKIKKCVE